jgi:PTS system nitrogen regulatory IIA component
MGRGIAMSLSLPHVEMPESRSALQLIALPRYVASGPHCRLPADSLEGTQPVGRHLREQDILLGMAAKGKRSALARIADRLGQSADMRANTVLAGLLRRERLGSTGIGYGVAVPHARLDGIMEPVAMLAVLESPVWFGAPDDEPVDLLLALLWPKPDVAGFLPALAAFCRVLRQPDLRSRLREAATPAEARAWLQLPDGLPVGPSRARRRQRQPSAGATWARMASMTCAL